MPERLLSRAFIAVFAANIFHELAWSLFLHFPGFLQKLDANTVEIGLLVGISALASIAIRPWVGKAMDERGRRSIILLGNALHVTVIALYLTVSSLNLWLWTLRITHGLASAMLFTALFTYAADIVPASRRTQGLALFGISGLFPIGLGGILGDVILAAGTFRTLFLVATCLAGAAFLLALPLQDVAIDTSSGERRGFLQAARQTNLLPLWFSAFVFSLALATFFTFLKTFVIETGIGSVGLFFAAYTGAAVLVRLVASGLPDRVGPKKVMLPAYGMMAGGFIVLSAASTPLHIAIAGVLSGIGHGYVFPIMFGMVVTRARPSERGSASAIYTAVFDIGTLVGGPLFGLAIQVSGYRAMWLLAAMIVIAGTFVFALWDRTVTN